MKKYVINEIYSDGYERFDKEKLINRHRKIGDLWIKK